MRSLWDLPPGRSGGPGKLPSIGVLCAGVLRAGCLTVFRTGPAIPDARALVPDPVHVWRGPGAGPLCGAVSVAVRLTGIPGPTGQY